MENKNPNTHQKAFELNLDPTLYGTIAEIGAGQEVARWFFRVGGASGTVAKTMSAYDMKFSDEIYGPDPNGRYVSRARLERMLEQEYDLVISRISDHRPEGTTFFAFANTVAAMGYRSRAECHGWIGIRIQTAPGAAPDDIILHVRMLDDTNVEQQDALGILGVNLIYGAFSLAAWPERLLRSLTDDLKWGRIEIDFVEFRGPNFDAIDNRVMSLELVKASVARAILFDPDGRPVVPADELYKRDVLTVRGTFRPVLNVDLDMVRAASAQLPPPTDGKTNVQLAELTMAPNANEGEIDAAEFLERVRVLASIGFHVLVSEYFRYFRVRQFLARYTKGAVSIVTDVDGFADILREEYYDGLDGGMLEALGKLFTPPATVFVYPMLDGKRVVTLDTMPVADRIRPIFDYLRGRGFVRPLDEADTRRLERNAAAVLDDLRTGGGEWRESVPSAAQEKIVSESLLGYRPK